MKNSVIRLCYSIYFLLYTSILFGQARQQANMSKESGTTEEHKKWDQPYSQHLNTIALSGNTVELPEPDTKLLAQIPKQPLTYEQLSQRLDQFSAQLKTKLNPAIVKEVEVFISRQQDNTKAIVLEAAALQSYMKGNLSASLLLQTAAVKADGYKDPFHLINLAGYFNLVGLPHASVTIMESLTKENRQAVDTSATAQNNYGHAWISLGKIEEGKKHYQKCLALDSLHPEALSVTGMIFLHGGQWQQAVANFKKALCVRYSPSDMICLKKIAQQQKKELVEIIDLYDVFRTKDQYYEQEVKSIYTDIGLEKLIAAIPPPPKDRKQHRLVKEAFEGYLEFLIGEHQRFLSASSEGSAGDYYTHNSSKREVHEAAAHLKYIYDYEKRRVLSKNDLKSLNILYESYSKTTQAIEKQFPGPPSMMTGGTDHSWVAIQKAYEQQCCDKLTPNINSYITQKNQIYDANFKRAVSNWKQYIDGLASIYSKDPSIYKQQDLNKEISNFLSEIIVYIEGILKSPDADSYCHDKLTPQEVEEMMALAEATLKCRQPKVKMNFGILSGSMENCDKIGLELDLGSLNLKLEQFVSTGKSLVFIGTKAKIDKFTKGFFKVGWEAGAVIAFDKTGITDLGVKGGAAVGTSFKTGNDPKKTIEFNPEIKVEGMVTIHSSFEGKIKVPFLEDIKF